MGSKDIDIRGRESCGRLRQNGVVARQPALYQLLAVVMRTKREKSRQDSEGAGGWGLRPQETQEEREVFFAAVAEMNLWSRRFVPKRENALAQTPPKKQQN